jgi:penicillin G amidase
MRRRLLLFLFGFVAVVILSTVIGGLFAWRELRASLPITEGTVALDGLTAPVSVERDGLGVPTISAPSRADAARALGFLHAQDRFFQMDLQRRQAAGELSGLVGARALDADRGMRVHRFRHIAQQAVRRTTAEYRQVLDAYAAGVNAGLQSLGGRPFEYLVLRTQPEPWQIEDTFLTVLAMFNTLQGRQAAFEATFGTMADTLPPAMYDFLAARGSEWDAPVVGEKFIRPQIPGPDVFDLRGNTETRKHGNEGNDVTEANEGSSGTPPSKASATPSLPCLRVAVIPCLSDEEAAGLGSNNWAVAGAHTASGTALVANDMHLAINVPNIWYRASVVVPDRRAAGNTIRITGVTLPGVPGVVVGSNGHVAWGFTNTGGDWSDLIIVEPDPRDASQYLTPSGPQRIERFTELIPVHGASPEPFDVEWTMWGPIVRTDTRGRKLAQHWVAHDAERLAADMMDLEQARTVDELLRHAAGLGIPAQNFVAGDTTGRIGWTIAGPVPRREGFDGSRPTSWADGSRRWNGYFSTDEQPRVIDPPAGRLWTANAPVVTGDMLAQIGEGGYADGIRARLIRDRLMGIDKATPADMLSVQLETSALFHERWRDVALAVLTPAVVQDDARRAEFRRLIETTWTGKADPASVAYLLVRTFRSALAREVFGALTAPIAERNPGFDYTRALRSEGPLWQLITERPRHLLNPAYASWDGQLVAAIDLAIVDLTVNGEALSQRSWGGFNRAMVTHPLGGAVPLAGRFVNMPMDPLPGDVFTPRAHSPRTGPSQRMAVSPGREAEGVLHMPGGQSGHPLSPHYSDQHRAWVNGDALPFLPGAPIARLMLVPAP